MRKHLVAGCSALFLVFLTFVLCTSCEITGDNYTEQWTLSGTITLSGTLANDVKMAVFYLGQDLSIDETKPLVSNVVNLGTTTASALPFSLDIDVSGIAYAETDTVDVWVWEDTNGNNAYDAGEAESEVEPAAGCPVFNLMGLAYFSYNASFPGIPRGWIVWNASDELVSVSTATLTGAVLQNWWDL
jgi:hypothetical protein